jgi:alpha-amylase
VIARRDPRRTARLGEGVLSYSSWSGNVDDLQRYISDTASAMSLFDVPLHYHFRDASVSGNAYDMRTILDRTLVKEQPTKAVTFVDNHDTQPCQWLESWVEPWFKPLAYALILLRREGYPCVFYGAYYEQPPYWDKGREVWFYSHRFLTNTPPAGQILHIEGAPRGAL